MHRVRAQHPAVSIPDPSAFYISRHGYDPNSYGAYSYFKPGWRDKYFRQLTKPLLGECAPGAPYGTEAAAAYSPTVEHAEGLSRKRKEVRVLTSKGLTS